VVGVSNILISQLVKERIRLELLLTQMVFSTPGGTIKRGSWEWVISLPESSLPRSISSGKRKSTMFNAEAGSLSLLVKMFLRAM